jgi:hypothetical protein
MTAPLLNYPNMRNSKPTGVSESVSRLRTRCGWNHKLTDKHMNKPEAMTPDSNIPAGPTKLLPCPFCGQPDAMAIWTNHEMCECEEDEGNALSYAVVCDASKPKGKGGCGGSAGFQASEAKAIEVWNRRAVLNAAPEAPADEPSVHSVDASIPPLPLEAASPQGSAAAPIGYGCFFPDGTLEPDLCSTNIKDCEFWRDADDAREKWTVKALYAAPVGELTALGAALRELVALKDLKDEELRMRQRRPVRDQNKLASCEAMRLEYLRRKPLAWSAARAALALQQEPKP